MNLFSDESDLSVPMYTLIGDVYSIDLYRSICPSLRSSVTCNVGMSDMKAGSQSLNYFSEHMLFHIYLIGMVNLFLLSYQFA